MVKYGTATKTFYWKKSYAGTIYLTWSEGNFINRFCIKISCSSFPTKVTSVTVSVSGYIKYSAQSSETGREVTPITEDTFPITTVTITKDKPGYLLGKNVTHDWYQTISSANCTLYTNTVTIDSKNYLVKMS